MLTFLVGKKFPQIKGGRTIPVMAVSIDEDDESIQKVVSYSSILLLGS